MVDFSQEAKDQGSLHIAVRSVGKSSKALSRAVRKVVNDMQPVQLAEPKGTVFFMRFHDGEKLPCWAVSTTGGTVRRTKWDQFSAHKSLHGILCVARCQDSEELESIRAGYQDICKAHQHALFSSKCIVYGHKKDLESCTDLKDGLVYVDCAIEELDVLPEDVQPFVVEKVACELVQSVFTKLKSRTENYLKLVEDPGRTDPLPQLWAPMETKETSEDEVEQRWVWSWCVPWCP